MITISVLLGRVSFHPVRRRRSNGSTGSDADFLDAATQRRAKIKAGSSVSDGSGRLSALKVNPLEKEPVETGEEAKQNKTRNGIFMESLWWNRSVGPLLIFAIVWSFVLTNIPVIFECNDQHWSNQNSHWMIMRQWWGAGGGGAKRGWMEGAEGGGEPSQGETGGRSVW